MDGGHFSKYLMNGKSIILVLKLCTKCTIPVFRIPGFSDNNRLCCVGEIDVIFHVYLAQEVISFKNINFGLEKILV